MLSHLPDPYATIWCEHRPLLEFERQDLTRRISLLAAEGEPGLAQGERLACETIASAVSYWNLKTASGVLLPISAESLAGLEPALAGALFALVTGCDDPQAAADRELADARGLVRGIRLALAHPEVANRDCDDCLRHIYDDSTGRRVLHGGRPVTRPAGAPAPCRLPKVGCPKGTPEEPRTLSAEHLRIWLRDREYRAVGRYPPDAQTARHAALIRAAEQADPNSFPDADSPRLS